MKPLVNIDALNALIETLSEETREHEHQMSTAYRLIVTIRILTAIIQNNPNLICDEEIDAINEECLEELRQVFDESIQESYADYKKKKGKI